MATTVSRPAVLMAFEAATLAIVSILHLTGAVHGGHAPYNRSGAGIAEAVVCLALVIGVIALVRSPTGARRAGLLATGFAILGFIVGLRFTLSGGAAIDLAYHSVMLPILIATALLLVRLPHR